MQTRTVTVFAYTNFKDDLIEYKCCNKVVTKVINES